MAFRVSREEVEARMASDEADQVMLARLDARGVRMEPAERPNNTTRATRSRWN
jgi:hypothetical protein